MPVKTYRAKTITDALNLVKTELGEDAMILSTKNLPPNVRDPYGGKMVEVAALPLKSNSHESLQNIDVIEEKTKFAQGAPISEVSPQQSVNPLGREDLQKELVSIKDLLFLLHQSQAVPKFIHMNPEYLNLYTRLVKAGITESTVKKIFSKVENDKDLDAKEVRKSIYSLLINLVPTKRLFEMETPHQQVAAFIGPTGVGKTTTIAKLAADLSLKKKKQVGIISIDGYRIGAVEQLKTYASIMGLVCIPAFSKEELAQAVKKFKDKEIILIDTAGQSHKDEEKIQELAGIISDNQIIQSHLVLSVTTKFEDLREATTNFAKLKPQTYIFTKVDEAKGCGNIFDQVIDFPMPISYITDGQKVPEDIFPATKKNIIELILKQ